MAYTETVVVGFIRRKRDEEYHSRRKMGKTRATPIMSPPHASLPDGLHRDSCSWFYKEEKR